MQNRVFKNPNCTNLYWTQKANYIHGYGFNNLCIWFFKNL